MKLLSVLICLLFLSSCAFKNLTPLTPATEIHSMDYFSPFSYINYVEQGNQVQLNDSLSTEGAQQLRGVLVKNKEVFRLANEIPIEQDSLRNKLIFEIVQLQQRLYENKKLEGVTLTPTITSVLDGQEQRFTSLTILSGFGRKKGNYGKQVAKAIGVGLLTLGIYTPVPHKHSLSITTFIFDKDKNGIAYYKNTFPVEKNPTNPKWIEKSLLGSYKGYLFK